MSRISGNSRVVGIFGDPIGHSISPAMQNAAFSALGLDFVYVPFHVRPAGLRKAVDAIRALDMAGVNVTIPHKEKVMRYLDEIDETAGAIGAVNTVVNRNGKLIGYNTDAIGYMRSLVEETCFSPKGKNAVILGAGGAARAVLFALLKSKVRSIVVANRTIERAKRLEREFKGIKAASFEDYAGYLEKADLVVNTTPLGMKPGSTLQFPFKRLGKNAVVSDIVYNPLKTAFIRKAESLGLKAHAGLGMLVHQGARGFELWTGVREKDVPVEVMRKAALMALREGGRLNISKR